MPHREIRVINGKQHLCCNKCHQRIHNGWIECPKDIIDLFSF